MIDGCKKIKQLKEKLWEIGPNKEITNRNKELRIYGGLEQSMLELEF